MAFLCYYDAVARMFTRVYRIEPVQSWPTYLLWLPICFQGLSKVLVPALNIYMVWAPHIWRATKSLTGLTNHSGHFPYTSWRRGPLALSHAIFLRSFGATTWNPEPTYYKIAISAGSNENYFSAWTPPSPQYSIGMIFSGILPFI